MEIENNVVDYKSFLEKLETFDNPPMRNDLVPSLKLAASTPTDTETLINLVLYQWRFKWGEPYFSEFKDLKIKF